MRHLTYIDPEATGHHVALYARAIWTQFLERGWSISWVTSPHALNHPATRPVLESIPGSIEIVEAPFPRAPTTARAPLQWLRYQLRHCRVLHRTCSRLRANLPGACTLHACLDQCDRILGLTRWFQRERRWAGLHMAALKTTGNSAGRGKGPAETFSAKLQARTLQHRALSRLFLLDPEYSLAHRPFDRHARLQPIPDITTPLCPAERGVARDRWRVPRSDTCILCFGAMSPRKGVHLLLQALRSHPPSHPCSVLIVGEQDPAFRAWAESDRSFSNPPSVRVCLVDRFVSADEEAELFAAADIVWAGYPHFRHPSGVLARATATGVSCIGGIKTSIGDELGRLGSGAACDLDNPADIARAVLLLAGRSRPNGPTASGIPTISDGALPAPDIIEQALSTLLPSHLHPPLSVTAITVQTTEIAQP